MLLDRYGAGRPDRWGLLWMDALALVTVAVWIGIFAGTIYAWYAVYGWFHGALAAIG